MPITGKDILLYEQREKIVTLTINRPERMNAISLELAERLEDAWIKFHEDEDAWICLITATGEKAFCTGWDLIDQAERDKKGLGLPKPLPRYYPNEIWKPTIAALNGYALAGGFQIAQECDIRIAADHAEFGIPEARWNLPAKWVCDLTRQIGLAHALELVLWGDKRITAQRAYEMGWINRMVPSDGLMDEAMTWAERMMLLAPRCVRNLKEIVYKGFYMPPQECLPFGEKLEANLEGMDDTIEGTRAFTEKRKPRFQNR